MPGGRRRRILFSFFGKMKSSRFTDFSLKKKRSRENRRSFKAFFFVSLRAVFPIPTNIIQQENRSQSVTTRVCKKKRKKEEKIKWETISSGQSWKEKEKSFPKWTFKKGDFFFQGNRYFRRWKNCFGSEQLGASHGDKKSIWEREGRRQRTTMLLLYILGTMKQGRILCS